MKNIPLLIGTIVGTVVMIVVVAMMFSGGNTTQTGQEVVDQTVLLEGARHPYMDTQSTQETEADLTEADLMEQTEISDASPSTNQMEVTDSTTQAKEVVTIIEFSDFQCPACKASLPAVDAVKAAYPGQIQVYYRHFPLDSIHPNARTAAIAVEAAASLDGSVFWDFHDRLFETQQEWSDIRDRQKLKDTFATYASELDLDRTQFLERMEDNSITTLVNNDVSLGTQLGVNSTPTFYVNGIKTSAPQLLTTVETILSK